MLKELDVSTRDVPWDAVLAAVHLFICSPLIVSFVEVATERLCQDADNGAHVWVQILRILQVLKLGKHIFSDGLVSPGLLEVVGACEEWVLDSLRTREQVYSGEHDSERLHYCLVLNYTAAQLKLF